MKTKEIQNVVEAERRARRVPDRMGWRITSILHVKGRVIVQAVSKRGRPFQWVEKVKAS